MTTTKTKYENIERVLSEKASNYIHAFRSGGGLRVLRLERNNELVGYGEAPNFDTALEYLEEDVAVGGRKYEDVYGEGKLHPHYWTGTTKVSSKIDTWLLHGRGFDIRNLHRRLDQGDYEFKSEFLWEVHTEEFKKFSEEAKNGEQKVVKLDGITYLLSKDDRGWGTMKVVVNSSGLDPWMRKFEIKYGAETLEGLLGTVEHKLPYWLEKK